ncbi:MAG: hypothetical protein HY247_04845 [archaeon]|nr:MAG: hypothetical protein HY247_04845 [archaeon]
MLSPKELAKRVLKADGAFQWVVVLSSRGETLAHEYSEGYAERIPVAKDTRERLGVVDAVFLEAAMNAEKWYGKMEFILLAYRKAKVMLTYVQESEAYIAVKIPRSAMAEHLFPKLKSALGKKAPRRLRRSQV